MQCYKSNGVSADSWKELAIILSATTALNPSVRAQLAFENQGANAGVLWLDTNGTLKFTSNTGANYLISMTQI